MGKSEFSFMRGKKCEVVTHDCKCYRWAYNERLTNAPGTLHVSKSETHPNCAVVQYQPQMGDSLITADLFFALEEQYPVAPASYYYLMAERYRRYQKVQKTPLPYFQYFHKYLPGICANSTVPAQLPHVSKMCSKIYELAIVPMRSQSTQDATTSSLIAPIILGTHIAAIFGLVLSHYQSLTKKKA